MSLFKFLFGSKAENTPEAKKASDEKSFDVLKYDGVRALNIGQADYAVKCLTAALAISDDLECHDYLSQALMRSGDLPAAIEQVNILSEAEPENVDIYLRKADIAYMMEDYKMVGDACEKALLYDSDNALALYMYGRACMAMGDDANAVAMLTKSLNAADSFGDAMLLRGRAYLRMGDIESAEADANHLLRLNPDNEDVLLLTAAVALQRGDNDEALNIYNKVIDMNPFCAAAFEQRAALRRQMGDDAGADADTIALHEINPESDDEDIARRVDESRRVIDPFGIG
ncbi:MAG: tetratricopeptide repeat protein [Prevotella sp.]|nr:tetratricopeptide repeat protein [Prevotella sp.]